MCAISCKSFCTVISKCLCLRWGFWNVADSLVLMLCKIFDAVDVDSRGVICWDDFTSFCVTVGRNQFRPSFKQSLVDYRQRLSEGIHLQARRMCFIPATQLLYAFDGDTPFVTVIGYVPVIKDVSYF